VAVVYPVSEAFDLAAEVLGNTASSQSGGENPVAPEAAGGEISGFIGTRWHFRPNENLFFGVGYDNNSATLLRFGISLKF
jgi:hypothetical protein